MAQQQAEIKNWKKNFFPFWGGQIISILGSSLVHFALIWWMTTSTNSAMVLAMATTVTFIPKVVLAPFVGALIDRSNRKLVLILADGSIALVTLVLVILFWTGAVQIWHVYIVLFLRALGETFHWPAEIASTTLMIPKEHYARINGINQMLQGGVQIIAPAMGALLISVLPMYSIFSIEIMTALLAIVPLLFVIVPQPKTLSTQEVLSFKGLLIDIREGSKYVIGGKGGRILALVAIMANFVINPVFNYLPLLVTRYFNGGAWHLSVLQIAEGTGMIGGGILLGVWGGFKKKSSSILLGLVAMSVSIIVLGIVPPSLFILAIVGLGLGSVMNAISNGVLFAAWQEKIPSEAQGRVFALLSSVTGVLGPVGLFLAAPLVDNVGVQYLPIISGILSMIIVLYAVSSSDLRNYIDGPAQVTIPGIDKDQSITSTASLRQ